MVRRASATDYVPNNETPMSQLTIRYALPRALPLLTLIALTQLPVRLLAQDAASSERVWFGFSISCSGCTMSIDSRGTQWTFATPPNIRAIESGSPADDAGLRPGDELLQIDGRDLTTSSGAARLAAVRPGQTVRFTVRRAERTLEIDVASGLYVAGQGTQAKSLAFSVDRDTVRRTGTRVETKKLQGDTLFYRRVVPKAAPLELKPEFFTLKKVTPDSGPRIVWKKGNGEADSNRVALLTKSLQPLRFSGSFGNADITVHGGANTVVSMADRECWMEIRTGDAVIRLERRDGCTQKRVP
jgi:membrane-associated protease RseP (regulator of RpoE activity)